MHFFRFWLPSFLLFFAQTAFCQITDDFSDGDFTQNPSWQGDIANFKINVAGELQLNAADAGQSVLAVAGNIADTTIWNLRFRMPFAPSGSNLLRIYLLADQAALAAANGYYLEIGETGSLDALRLYRQDGGSKTLLATGQPALVAANPDIHLRIKRSKTGDWNVEAAASNGALQPQFTVNDPTYGGGVNRFFGFICTYTSSNKANFYFDNISILPDVPDTKPPVLLSAKADDATHVTVIFDETLDSLSAVNASNYIIAGASQIASASLLSTKNSVLLTLPAPLATGSYTLQTSGVKDIFGNNSTAQTTEFQFIKIEIAEEYDIVINEIMADPTPAVGLPESEWIELYNRSAKTLNLSTLRLADGTGTPAALPAYPMPPNTYVVLTALGNLAQLRAVSPDTVLVGPLSSSALNNDSDILTLTNAAGAVVDRVEYRISWHTNASKDDGGWSLERINPNTPCVGRANWQSCSRLPGGTPGGVNASFSLAPDATGPRLLDAYPTAPTVVQLHFSEGLDRSAAQNTALYQLSPTRNIASAQLLSDRAVVTLTLAEPLQKGEIYLVEVAADLKDCSANSRVINDSIFVGLPEKPDPQDIVINEIMFNPETGGARYVEFYNRSTKVLDWSEFFIANLREATVSIEQVAYDRLLLPRQYDVYTTDALNVRTRFQNIHYENVLRQALPSLADDEGNISVYWSKGGQTVMVDSFDYSEDYHNGLFNDSQREGVSLERIRSGHPTNDPANWTSAAAILTGVPGSPTLPNSQLLDDAPAVGDDLITLSAERLSPDSDGFEDFLDIQYTLPREGYAATMTLFDSDGVPVRRLARQQLLGTEGALRWDGDLDDGTKARPGIYVLFLEVFSPDGDVRRVKKAVGVLTRF